MKCNIQLSCHIILNSPLTMADSYTTNVCLNREPIAEQSRCRVLQSRMPKYTCPFIILRLAFAIGSHIYIYTYIIIHMVTPTRAYLEFFLWYLQSKKHKKILSSFLCDLHTTTSVRYRLTLVFLQFLNCHLVAPHPKTPRLPFPSK